MTRRKKRQELKKEFKLFEANDVAKYGIMSVAGNALAPTAYKALVYSIWKCNQNTPGEFGWVTMTITELGEALGYAKDKNCHFARNAKYVCDVMKDIMSEPISIRDTAKKRIVSFVWVQRVEVDYEKDIISIQFSDALSEYFGQELQKNFTVVKLKYLNRLTTTAAVVLYPFFCRYVGMKHFNYFVSELSLLLTDIDHYEYKRIRSDSLIPAIKAINEKTDLHVEFHPIKTGRQVTSVAFTVTREPAADEYEHFMDYNHVKFDETEIVPYNDTWMDAYDYDMATQTYKRKTIA